jgi:hypothetical protein
LKRNGEIPAVTIDTRATIGRFASIVNIKGVILAEKRRDDIENAFRPRTVFRRGPSYTTFTVSLGETGIFEADTRNGVRIPPVRSVGLLSGIELSVSIVGIASAVVDTGRFAGLSGGRPVGCN